MRTIYELQLVEGMDLFTIQLLVPFVTVGSSEDVLNSWKFRDVMRASQHELIARFDGTFEPKHLPLSTSPFQVKRTAFSNKAFMITEINTDVKVLGLAKNSYGIFENPSTLTEKILILQLEKMILV